MKNVLVILTGGTIVSIDNGNGLEPNNDNFIKKFTDNWECDIDYTCPFNVDSSQIEPEHWCVIAKIIDDNLKKYSGFLVTHGTDTLAYTSTALSLMLKNIDKPIVVTGSQIPLNEKNSDAPTNLCLAGKVLLESKLCGVFTVFGGKIMKGAYCSKTKSEDLDAFESINCDDVLLQDVSRVKDHYKFKNNVNKNKVFLLKAFPGINSKIISTLNEIGYKYFVIEAYGKGSLTNEFVPEIKKIVEHGGKVGIVTQCRYNGSDCYKYKSSRDIINAGAFDYGIHSTEYAVVDMMLSQKI